MAIVRLRNINPLGRVDLPLVGREGDIEGEGEGCLEPGEEFDGPEELLEQASNYEPVDEAAFAADARIEANAFRHRKAPADPSKAAPRKTTPRKAVAR